MNNFYHKLAVASVCSALGFFLGASPEAKAATFNTSYPYPLITFHAIDGGSFGSFDGLGDRVFSVTSPNVDWGNLHSWDKVERTTAREIAALVEFSIPYLTNASTGYRSDTRITNIINAVLRIEVEWWPRYDLYGGPRPLRLFGYVGNGTAEASDFEAGVFLDSTIGFGEGENGFAYFNVDPFLNELVNNNNEFAGFALRSLTENPTFLSREGNQFKNPPTLFVEAEYETVPEPTTIFGSAIGLCLGGWLKRNNTISLKLCNSS
jgi:hypothetical protein